MTDRDTAAKLGIFIVRGLKKRLHAVDQLASELLVLAICKTWTKKEIDSITQVLGGSVAATAAKRLLRGYGLVSVIINLLLRYEIRSYYATNTVQAITVQVASTMVTVIYISPRATAKKETDPLDRLHRLSGTKEVIMGDINARHTTWDTRCNVRG